MLILSVIIIIIITTLLFLFSSGQSERICIDLCWEARSGISVTSIIQSPHQDPIT